SFRVATFTQRAKADQPGAQQRSCDDVFESVGNGKTKARVSHDKFGITAVDIVTGETGPIAKIFATGSAEFAFTTSPAHPWNTDAIAFAKFFHVVSGFFDVSH